MSGMTDNVQRSVLPIPDYTAHGSTFNGKINWVQIDLG
jgi:hypothetical protein